MEALPRTRLVQRATGLMVPTSRRETDCRTALTRGIQEYIAPLEINWAGGRAAKFKKVFHTWAEPEDLAEYPSAAVYAVDQGTYDESEFTPQTTALPNEPGMFIRTVSEFSQLVSVEIWTTDPVERMALVAMLEDAFDPVEHQSGFVLELPHYYGMRATFELMAMAYLDDAQSAQKRWRRALFVLRGTVPRVVPAGKLPLALPRFSNTILEAGEVSADLEGIGVDGRREG